MELKEQLTNLFGEKAKNIEKIARTTLKKVFYDFSINTDKEERKTMELTDDEYLLTERLIKVNFANGDSNPDVKYEIYEYLIIEHEWNEDELDSFTYMYVKSMYANPYYDPEEEEELGNTIDIDFDYDSPVYNNIAGIILMYSSEFDLSGGRIAYEKEDFDEQIERYLDYYLNPGSYHIL